VSYAVVARAPIDEIEAVRKEMGWRFTWVSSYRSDFNYDFHVSFTPEEIAAGRAFYSYEYVNPGLEDRSGDSVFFRNDAGQIFHTYSTYGRGGEEFLGICARGVAAEGDRGGELRTEVLERAARRTRALPQGEPMTKSAKERIRDSSTRGGGRTDSGTSLARLRSSREGSGGTP